MSENHIYMENADYNSLNASSIEMKKDTYVRKLTESGCNLETINIHIDES